MNFPHAMQFILSFSRLGKKVSDLSRIADLMNKLGNPQDKLKFIHIAGTNGKGSTLELCSNALINAGYQTGQFTSPYLLYYNDRIRINNVNISGEKIGEICETVKAAVSERHYSQFEITFAIAMLYYVQEKCDIVVLETGLGGLLDATNIIKSPVVSLITSVSFDHEAILGNTIQKIARQKAGIIKNNIPCVLSMGNDSKCVKIVSDTANLMNSPLIIPSENDLQIISQDIYGSKFIYKGNEYFTKMSGLHQIQNSCTVIECIEILNNNGFNISTENIRDSLKNTTVIGRTEIINENPVVILDGSHNFDGVTALFRVTESLHKPVIAVLGILERKDYQIIVEAIESEFTGNTGISEVICVDGFEQGCVESSKLAGMFSEMPAYSMNYESGYEFALKKAKEENKAIAIFGSLYLVSRMKKEMIV